MKTSVETRTKIKEEFLALIDQSIDAIDTLVTSKESQGYKGKIKAFHINIDARDEDGHKHALAIRVNV